jgi:hypothetical protein
MKQYPQYKGHDVVGALQIASVNELGINKARFTLEGSPMYAEELSMEEHPFVRGARVGDYLIQHPDGHFSYVPAHEFEGVYVKLEKQPSEDTPLRPAERQEQDQKLRALADESTKLPGKGEELGALGLPKEVSPETNKVPDPMVWPGDDEAKQAKAEEHHSKHEKHHGKEHKK